MVKHNNVIPNGHFKKHWQNYVKTWFNQPARKTRRRAGRFAFFFPITRSLSDAIMTLYNTCVFSNFQQGKRKL